MICLLKKVGRSPQEFRREGRVLSKKGKHVVRRAGNLEHSTMMSLVSQVSHIGLGPKDTQCLSQPLLLLLLLNINPGRQHSKVLYRLRIRKREEETQEKMEKEE